jgi:uncharacterized protein
MNPIRRSLLKVPKFLAAYPLLSSAGAFAANPAETPALFATKPGSLEANFIRIFDQMWIADSHEHLIFESERTSRDFDFFDLLSHYTLDDLTAAGLSADDRKRALNKEVSDEKRWATIEEYWRYSRFTGYAVNLRIAVADIYGFDVISSETIGKINAVIRARNKPGIYRQVLKDHARIQYYVLDDRHVHPSKPDREFFVLVREFDDFIVPQSRADIRALEGLTNTSITNLAALEAALQIRFNEALAAEICGVKTLLAYKRDLFFAEVKRGDAEADFARMMQIETNAQWDFRRLTNRPFRNLEDHMFHEMVRLANAHRIPIQVHTGLNDRNYIANSNPTHLTNLFFLYPDTKFVIFHLGYPYLGELAVLAKSFTNVYVDFNWAHIISPTATTRMLPEYLDTVPSNKIFAFGGDFLYPELSYAHSKIARRVCAKVLSARTEDGWCTEDEALELGRRMLFDNVTSVFWPGTPQKGPA